MPALIGPPRRGWRWSWGAAKGFAIAGLLHRYPVTSVTGNGVPVIGDVPVLGALFRSDNFQRNETELVIVVTPYVVRPVASASMLRLPTDGYAPPSDLERILLLHRPTGTAYDTGFRWQNQPSPPHPRAMPFIVQ